MSKVMTAPGTSQATPGPIAPMRQGAQRVCENTALSGGVRGASPSRAPIREPGCVRAQSRTVQPELPKVSGSSAILTALLLVAIAFGMLFLGSWRAEAVSGVPQQHDVAAHIAAVREPGQE